jgi:hypothetical protein
MRTRIGWPSRIPNAHDLRSSCWYMSCVERCQVPRGDGDLLRDGPGRVTGAERAITIHRNEPPRSCRSGVSVVPFGDRTQGAVIKSRTRWLVPKRLLSISLDNSAIALPVRGLEEPSLDPLRSHCGPTDAARPSAISLLPLPIASIATIILAWSSGSDRQSVYDGRPSANWGHAESSRPPA